MVEFAALFGRALGQRSCQRYACKVQVEQTSEVTEDLGSRGWSQASKHGFGLPSQA